MYEILDYTARVEGSEIEAFNTKPKKVGKKFNSLSEIDQFENATRIDLLKKYPDCEIEVFARIKKHK